ncbi:MAG: hypothetical protein ABIH83_04250 [Candidatus Micrarchaeota archaeon]
MSQLEREVHEFMLANPAIRKSYSAKLINRRALARKIIREMPEIKKANFEAIIAVLRRMEFEKEEGGATVSLIRDAAVVVKDNIAIANLQKSNELVKRIERIIPKISYEKNETFKFVVGTSSIKIFLDEKNLHLVDAFAGKREIIYIHKKITEISLQFPEKAVSTKGILSFITSSLSINDVIIEEFLSCSPELLIYVRGGQALKAYETIKKMQK